ncbi:MAG: FAD-binding oxidoreductase [Chloroflexi bacterium]|nr:FAD-binding oxidoreductase [Chloroflexota bacterium]
MVVRKIIGRPSRFPKPGRSYSSKFEPQLDWEFLDTLTRHALHRAPMLVNARVMRGWAGLRALTPDDYPILGYAPNVEGFINACGWGGHGVMHAPIAGQLIAELIADGKTTTLDIAPFDLSRLSK